MANSELKVILKGEDQNLTSTLSKAGTKAQEFGEMLEQATDPAVVQKLNSELDKTNRQFNKIKNFKGGGFDDFTQKARSAGQAGFAFNQILREAPAFAFSVQTGLLGISNNLPIFTDALKKAKEAGSSNTEVIKSLGKQLISLPSILSLGVLALTLLAGAFGDTKTAAEASEIALKKYGDAIDGIKDGVSALNEELQFANQLGGLNVQIAGGNAIQDLKEQSIAQRAFTQKLEEQRDKLKILGDSIADNAELSAKDRIDAELKILAETRAIGVEIAKSENTQNLIYAKIRLQRKEDQDKANKDSIEAQDKFINDTIARARRLAAFLTKTTIRNVNFDLDPELTKGEQFTEAITFINKALNDTLRRSNFAVKTQVLIDGIDLKPTQKYFQDQKKNAEKLMEDLQEEIRKLSARNPIVIEAGRIQAEQKARGAELASSLGLNLEGINAPISLLTDMQKEAVNAANTISGVLVPAFGDLFGAIVSGENPIKAFFQGIGQAVQQLIQKLIQAAVQALIISAIFPGFAGGGGFANIFKSLLGFKAEGGPVSGGRPYVVGEKGPELFIPTGGGRIIPNDQISGGTAGVQGGPVNVGGRIVVQGKDLALVLARVNGSQKNNF